MSFQDVDPIGTALSRFLPKALATRKLPLRMVQSPQAQHGFHRSQLVSRIYKSKFSRNCPKYAKSIGEELQDVVRRRDMDNLRKIEDLLQRLNRVCDWTFALGLHVRFASPTLSYLTYPKEWVDYYTEKELVFVDPTVRWAISNQGICDWEDLADGDQSDVFGAAARFGLRFGKVIALGELDRSLGFFAHPSRPITQDEIEQAQTLMQELHDVTRDALDMSEEELEKLRQIIVPA
ncbi:hypothetical protein F8R15_02605 [Thioclava sp. JE_KL1]|nr:hypothetical protein [Thioclava sp. JE_KL1]